MKVFMGGIPETSVVDCGVFCASDIEAGVSCMGVLGIGDGGLFVEEMEFHIGAAGCSGIGFTGGMGPEVAGGDVEGLFGHIPWAKGLDVSPLVRGIELDVGSVGVGGEAGLGGGVFWSGDCGQVEAGSGLFKGS